MLVPALGLRHQRPHALNFADGQEEVIAAGGLFYLPPGHIGVVEEEFEGTEFSPPAAHQQMLNVVERLAQFGSSRASPRAIPHVRLAPLQTGPAGYRSVTVHGV